jgi:hypothetical protein
MNELPQMMERAVNKPQLINFSLKPLILFKVGVFTKAIG